MSRSLHKSVAIGFSAIGLSLFAHPGQADPYLPGLTNLNFVNYTGSAPKNYFVNVDPVGWTGGNGLIFIDSPTAANQDAAGPVYLQTYADPTPNLPGNYVEADGNPSFESGFSVQVTGLTVGQAYSLQFFQAASQQTGFVGATTNQWIVSLGTSGLYVPNVNSCDLSCTYANTDATASIVATPVMDVPTGTATPWESVTVSLTADATTDLLSFLAWGDNGSEVNLPPMAFLTGVDSPNELPTPEPGTLSLLGAGLLGLGVAIRRRRAKRAAAI